MTAAATAWLRLPPVTRDTLWAEDGRNFLQGAVEAGPIAPLFDPYAGYLHVLPRLLAGVTVTFFPVAQRAEVITALTCAVAGGVAVADYVSSTDAVRWHPARIIIAMLTVLTPLADREVLGNAANLHSLMMWMAFWALVHRPRHRFGSVGLALLLLLASLTEIQTLLLLPLLLYKARDRSRWIPRAAFFVGVVTQVTVTLALPRSVSHAPPVDPASMAYGFLVNAVLPSWMSPSGIGPLLVAAGRGWDARSSSSNLVRSPSRSRAADLASAGSPSHFSACRSRSTTTPA